MTEWLKGLYLFTNTTFHSQALFDYLISQLPVAVVAAPRYFHEPFHAGRPHLWIVR